MRALPVNADELTPAWLSEVLGIEVVNVKVLDHAVATNQRVRIALSYATPDEGPSSLFVKLAPLDPVHREMIGASGMGEREASFYADVARSLDLRVPHVHFAASSDDGNFAILLEDLAAGGARSPTGSGESRLTPPLSLSRSWRPSTPGSRIRRPASPPRPGWRSPGRSRPTSPLS